MIVGVNVMNERRVFQKCPVWKKCASSLHNPLCVTPMKKETGLIRIENPQEVGMRMPSWVEAWPFVTKRGNQKNGKP